MHSCAKWSYNVMYDVTDSLNVKRFALKIFQYAVDRYNACKPVNNTCVIPLYACVIQFSSLLNFYIFHWKA